MAMLQSGAQVHVATVAPDLAMVIAAHDQLAQQYPMHRLTVAAMDTTFAAVKEQSSQGPAGWKSALRGGGVYLCR